ncbi:DUF4062 domain-containing protein [Bacillus thuringiensis]|uniref:DUF4062 domain-containing protein n=1 Tax=Bacillus thuringiensis TaxID=1428 RepID=UPI000CD91132|nr:DUF4062 domain-containing protein [Bacillus thuringiensis]QFQ28501.1 DUF4062 domain-containing protein [Bacillus thuringiensis]
MKKKLQVFISSTFKDLIEERQSAVEAVLSSGHIPAGMELFKAGDESQKETIKRWIDESDVYLLILGGRYGSIEAASGKSYTHWEYDYAEEVGIPRFAVVIDKEALDVKIKKIGGDAIEIENARKYEEFKKQVLSKTSEFFSDLKDIKLTIHRKLAELGSNDELAGWVSAKDIRTNETLINEISRLMQENSELKGKVMSLKSNTTTREENNSKNKVVTSYPLGRGEVSTRVERILKIYNAERQEKFREITWVENENDEIILPAPRDRYQAYFKIEEDYIEEIMIIGIVNSLMSFNDSLSEIRVMLSEQKDIIHNMPIRFIIAMQGEHPKKVEIASEFFDKAMDYSEVNDNELYSLDIWDEKRLAEIEKELALAL